VANRYWVGGTATWDGTAGTKWSATSGGAGGASVPTAADDVFFDANSGAGTVTIGTGRVAKTLNCTGFTGTLGNSINAFTVSGNVTLDAGVTYSAGQLTINATSTLITAGKTLTGGLRVSGTGITVTLGDALTATQNFSNQALVIDAGTFTTDNYNVTTAGFIASGTSTRVINLGSSTVVVNGANGCDFSGTNITVNAGTSTIQGTVTPFTFNGGGNTFYNVSNTANSGGGNNDFVVLGANTFNNLTISSNGVNGKTLALGDDQTVNGTLTCAGPSFSAHVFVFSNTIGTTRTITAAAVSADDCDFRDITIAGAAAPISPTRVGDCGGNSGITFPAAKTVYRVGTNINWAGSNSWALTSGGTGSNNNFPLAQDTVVIDENTALTGTLNLIRSSIGNLDASTRTTGITLNHNGTAIRYGDYTLGSGVTVSGTSVQTFAGRGTQTFTSAGKTITFPITVEKPAGAFELGDAYDSSNTITHTRGTFDAKNYNVTCTTFSSSNLNTRTIMMGSGLWTLSGTGTVWNCATTTNLTFNKDTADILLSNTTTTARTFEGGGLTYNKLTIGGATGVSTLTITGANTFTELASTKTVAHTIVFPNTTTTVGAWTISGTSGNVVTLQRTGAIGTWTIAKTGGGVVDADFLSISNSTATPSNTWYAGNNSTNGVGNTGWIFTPAPAIAATGNFFMLFS
jgi:hypothetical protein